MKKQLILLAIAAGLAFFCPKITFGQTQTLKGRILDKSVRSELIGASVQIGIGTGAASNLRGTVTDANGQFRFEKLPLGKYTITVSFLGFKNAVIPNIELNAGKETDLTIELEEHILVGKEAVIRATIDKEKPLNELSTVSTRTFSVDETRRFAAGFSDPARMAVSFAGVVAGTDGNNHIVIRGNAPNGLLWRMEGVDIPNPNHFSSTGTSGGGISIISAQLLSNSDFSTGAFAAEYGNALSGVFDLRLRKGNSDRREHTVQVGVLGVDLATEGPFRMGKNTGSYLVNYRYSSLSMLAAMGVPLGDEVTKFQDLSFNIAMPAGKIGTFSLFGIGGLSSSINAGEADSSLWKANSEKKYPYDFLANTGAIGLTHNKTWGGDTWLKTILAASKTENTTLADQFVLPNYARRREYESSAGQQKITVSTVLSHKFSARHYLRTGVYVHFLGYDFSQSDRDEDENRLVEQLRQRGNTESVQAFAQWQYRPTERVTFNAGLHSLALLLNKTASIEPRTGLKYAFSDRQSISIGYGLHGQLQPLGVYFLKDENGKLINPDLEMTKSQHFVLAYDQMLRKNLRLKTEVYHQKLFNAPVNRGEKTSFSMLNQYSDTPFEVLENTGRGRNFGLELTLEQFLSRGFYFLASSSIFKSEYRGSDKIWRNTLFDSGYASTLTAGKEWDWAKKGRDRSFGLNMKLVSVGGHWQTPIDLAASIAEGGEVLDEKRAFSEKLPDYFRLDVGVKLKRNYRRLTSTVSLDIQNVTNRKNIGGKYYDAENFEVKYWEQAPLLPILAYKLEF